jgi:hypothetical protein
LEVVGWALEGVDPDRADCFSAGLRAPAEGFELTGFDVWVTGGGTTSHSVGSVTPGGQFSRVRECRCRVGVGRELGRCTGAGVGGVPFVVVVVGVGGAGVVPVVEVELVIAVVVVVVEVVDAAAAVTMSHVATADASVIAHATRATLARLDRQRRDAHAFHGRPPIATRGQKL